MMSDKYKNGKIYTIRHKNDDSLIYVGSTIQPLCKRWHQHKEILNNKNHKSYNMLLYQKMRATNVNDWYIECASNGWFKKFFMFLFFKLLEPDLAVITPKILSI
jgi:hypothetical protein